MSTLNDDELRSALARRASTSLTSDERNDVLRAARVQATEPRRRQPVLPRLAGLVAAIAAVLVLVIVVLPILLSPPGPDARQSTSPSAGGLRIYSGVELAALAGDDAFGGRTVLSNASIRYVPTTGTACRVGVLCSPSVGVIDGTDVGVSLGWRDATPGDGMEIDDASGHRWVKQVAGPAPGDASLSAFTVNHNSVQFVGSAVLADQKSPLAVTQVLQADEKAPTDNVYVVHGWWWSGLWPNCPAQPQSTPVELDFYCNGFWLTPNRPETTSTTKPAQDALLLATGEYPTWSDGRSPGTPVEGTFVVRSAGCQITLDDRCPVWRLVGRLDDATTSQPSPAQPSPPPSGPPTSVQSPDSVFPVLSAQELADKIGDPNWIGKAVLARASITELDRACVPEPNICARAGELDGVSGLNEVTAGYRDSTSASHFSVDEGNGYRWLTPLEIPSGAGLFAFTIQKDAVEFLGPAYLSPAGNPVKVSDLAGVSSTLPSDGVIAVSGWLMHTLEAPCAFPQEGLRTPMPDISSYYCGGSWLTDEPAAQPVSGLTIEGGAHVQNDAYDTFANDPQTADGGGTQPRQGIYLVRNAGCPEVVTGNCPVWRMVGRLDATAAPAPLPTVYSSPPPDIAIPTGTAPPNSSPQPCPAAVLTSFLVADETFGVAAARPGGPVVKIVWPFGYRAVPDGDRVALLDESGLLLAHTGDYVSIGGGDMPDGSFNGCGGVTVVGPDGSSPPDASATPPGTAGKIEYFHLADALVSARSAISDPSAQLRSYAPGDYDSVVQILLGPWAASVPPPNGATGRTMVWGVSFLTGKLLATVYIDLFSGDVYGIETRNVPTNLADIHKSDIVFGDLTVQVANNTTLDVSIYVNGTLAAAAPANQGAIVDPYEFGPAPWTIRTTTSTGRELTTGVLDPKTVWGTIGDYPLESQSFNERIDLSCGRLDLWAGGVASGPAPPASFPPGDCDP